MNEYLSVKLRIISFLSMLLVVLAHSYNVTVKFNSGNLYYEGGYNVFIQNFFDKGIVRIIVPIFFGVAGYLFFLRANGTIDEFILKFRKRAKSLVVPYLLWSLWGLFFSLCLTVIPSIERFFYKSVDRRSIIDRNPAYHIS